jgi:hypothetical protein
MAHSRLRHPGAITPHQPPPAASAEPIDEPSCSPPIWSALTRHRHYADEQANGSASLPQPASEVNPDTTLRRASLRSTIRGLNCRGSHQA